ncbi:MAG TPA: carboxypeptidase-like regulatory domain-containing protein [Terriglobales bacterium]|jgi:hypothetical protein|nr:carboxypeptidase-like regulatory domain-containing protein [Terriglobales bacterium]
MIKLLVFALLVVPLSSSQDAPPAPQTGRIEGIVRNEAGTAEPSITLHLSKVDSHIKLGTMRHEVSDKAGRFAFEKVKWGSYRVYATSEKDYYPDSTFAFYSGTTAPLVDIAAASPNGSVEITLGPKAGAVVGTVIDKVSREPVLPRFRLAVRSDPTRWMETSVPSKFRILLPSATDITLEVSSPGYQRWYYNNASDASGSTPLRVNASEERNLIIELIPSKDSSRKSPPN